MNDQIHGRISTGQYDLLYGDKDYQAECDLIEEVFRSYAKSPVATILDLSCDTGGHAFPLALRGYRVTGVDCPAEIPAHAGEKDSVFQLPGGSVNAEIYQKRRAQC